MSHKSKTFIKLTQINRGSVAFALISMINVPASGPGHVAV